MKKRIKLGKTVGALVLAVALSTTLLGGTLAKYVSASSGSDTARVAKWGVNVVGGNGLFSDEYECHNREYKDSIKCSVKSANKAGNDDSDNAGDLVVAPGTSGQTSFVISGSPEVACNLEFDLQGTDICIPAGTKVPGIGKLDKNYNPLYFVLSKFDKKENKSVVIAQGTFEEVKKAFNNQSKIYKPNEVLDDAYSLSWMWNFESAQDKEITDLKDTFLGNAIACPNKENKGCITNFSFEYSVSVTQID